MNTQYIDITWLTTFGLRTDNVLDYFYTSPFYDPNCNNEIPPHLFVIRKQERKSKLSTETLDIFYCLDGILYQCPVFLDVLKARLAKASLALSQSFGALQEVMDAPNDPQGKEALFGTSALLSSS